MRKTLAFVLLLCLMTAMVPNVGAQAAAVPGFTIKCNAVYLINADTGSVVYSKNADQKVYPASITKLMTAILTVEKFGNNLDKTVTIEHADTDPLYGTSSSTAGIKPGEQLTIRQLLYCLLLQSANESANALAREVAGSIQNFVPLMNKKAQEIGAKDTHYVNPHGLQDPNHYTTAYDTYLIAKYAMSMKNGIIKSIVGTKSKIIPKTNTGAARTLVNTNKLMSSGSSYYYKYCQGIKTGTTSEAGYCLASYAVKGDYTYYCIAMGGPYNGGKGTNYAFSDTKSLYEWAFKTYTVDTIVPKNEPVAEIKVGVAWHKDSIKLYPQRPFNTLVPKKSGTGQVKVTPHVPASVMAPVKSGQVVGSADVYYSNKKVGTIKLVSNDTVERSSSLYFLYITGRFFSSIWFKILCVTLVVLFVGYISLTVNYNRKKQKFNLRRGSRKYKIK